MPKEKHTSFPLVSVSFPKPHVNHRPRLSLFDDGCLNPDQITPGCEKTRGDKESVLAVLSKGFYFQRHTSSENSLSKSTLLDQHGLSISSGKPLRSAYNRK